MKRLLALLLLIPSLAFAHGTTLNPAGGGGVIEADSCTTDDALMIADGTGGTQLKCVAGLTFASEILTVPGQGLFNKDFGSGDVMLLAQDDGSDRFKVSNLSGINGFLQLAASGTTKLQMFAGQSGQAFPSIETVSGNNFRLRAGAGGLGNADLQIHALRAEFSSLIKLINTTLTIDTSTEDVTVINSYHIINGFGASADTLVTINGGEEGDILWIKAGDAAIELDCVAPSGNLLCPGAAADVVLAIGEVKELLLTDAAWTADRENN